MYPYMNLQICCIFYSYEKLKVSCMKNFPHTTVLLIELGSFFMKVVMKLLKFGHLPQKVHEELTPRRIH